MRTIQGPGPVTISVVCCPHGDELIGQVVFEHYEPIISNYPGLQLVFANEEAHRQNVRFIDTDLNRSFVGVPASGHEAALAGRILPLITSARYVLDLHTTTSDLVMTPIVANLNPGVHRVLNLTSSREIALMSSEIAAPSLIGQVRAGVSLEFNHEYARTPKALTDITSIIDHLLGQSPLPRRPRSIYHISGTIPLDQKLNPQARNFRKLPGQNIYPFLLHEKSYTTSQGFAAHLKTRASI